MTQPQQQPRMITPQSATTTVSIATVCHLVAGGAIAKVWALLQMDTTTQAQNQQLVLMCVIALITLATGVTLLHILITNYKCWVSHVYNMAAQKTEPPEPDAANQNEEPSEKQQAPPEPPEEQPEPPTPTTEKRPWKRWRF